MDQKRSLKRVDQLPISLRSREGWARMLEMRRPRDPHVHQIEPTNHCPYACVMCPRTTRMTRELGFMDMALYRKLIDEIAGFEAEVRDKEIELFHFGESVLHPELAEMVSYGSARGLKMTLSINAPHLAPERADSLLAAGAFRLIISLDGFDDPSYRAIRGKVASFGKAVANLEALAERLRRQPTPTLVLLRIIELAANREHIGAMRSHWESQGLKVEIREFFPWTEREMAGLGTYERYPPFMPCPFPWQYLVVQWDGSVVGCCRDSNAENRLGDARFQSLREIWNGPAYDAFRRQHETGDYSGNPLCESCMALYYTEG